MIPARAPLSLRLPPECWRVEPMRSGTGLLIKGELKADEDLVIDGTFEGTIDLPGYGLVTGAGSIVRAAATARTVMINGHLDGHITADIVSVGPKATVEAKIIPRQIALQRLVRFNH